jgi:dihydrofolate reductase
MEIQPADAKVTLCFATSRDGFYKPKSGEFIHSAEDQIHFLELMEQSDAEILGRQTFDDNRDRILANLTPHLLRSVLVHDANKYRKDNNVPGMLEFYNISVEQLVDGLIRRGKKNILVVSGSPASQLLFAKRADIYYQTVEPFSSGQGKRLAGFNPSEWSVTRGYPKPINDQGTYIMRYEYKRSR